MPERRNLSGTRDDDIEEDELEAAPDNEYAEKEDSKDHPEYGKPYDKERVIVRRGGGKHKRKAAPV